MMRLLCLSGSHVKAVALTEEQDLVEAARQAWCAESKEVARGVPSVMILLLFFV
jgi:hypothetical protein